LRLGEAAQVSDTQENKNNKPKLGGFGLGLDLSKAQQLQQQHLSMAEEKKSHARGEVP
jgi:hypothetical protein